MRAAQRSRTFPMLAEVAAAQQPEDETEDDPAEQHGCAGLAGVDGPGPGLWRRHEGDRGCRSLDPAIGEGG